MEAVKFIIPNLVNGDEVFEFNLHGNNTQLLIDFARMLEANQKAQEEKELTTCTVA